VNEQNYKPANFEKDQLSALVIILRGHFDVQQRPLRHSDRTHPTEVTSQEEGQNPFELSNFVNAAQKLSHMHEEFKSQD
jgi:hypothetical protein